MSWFFYEKIDCKGSRKRFTAKEVFMRARNLFFIVCFSFQRIRIMTGKNIIREMM
jgi:hypothetical protein